MVYRVYVEKKEDFAVEAAALQAELVRILDIQGLVKTRIVQRYDVEGIGAELFERCARTVLSEPPVDKIYYRLPQADFICAIEYLPGQFDQRADSAAECIQLVSHGERPRVMNARLYLFEGSLTVDDKHKIEKYLINPVDSRRADPVERETLQNAYAEPRDIESIAGFTGLEKACLKKFIETYSLAMDENDLAFCVNYFKGENRNPTVTELRVIDTYWSDHCRHTTFSTILDDIEIEADGEDGADGGIQKTYRLYLDIRKKIHKKEDAPVTLMDIATIGAKYLSGKGGLKNWDRGPENNACSIKIKVDNGGKDEDWLLLFKNETHNHPTEIEPFGGAATCIGGAIRDPLSGRAYVYQALRVTGAGDPFSPVQDTPKGKLPQCKLVTTAAQGYSSYGNQVGLATGLVEEFYHQGYTAKRMEIGAVLAAVPAANVRREEPCAGDLVLLVGGRTGRDGCGGATGSSKAHKKESLETCGAEVQKGNAPVERCLQRLFRDGETARMIKRCNDFGAGGVSVAIGELACGLSIDLDAVPKKYEGLDGTELAISESQERMAVVVDKNDAGNFIARAAMENLEATAVAVVTGEKRLVMKWRGKTIVDISRDFLNSAGAEKHASVLVKRPQAAPEWRSNGLGASRIPFKLRLAALLKDLNVCCRKGLFERFDSTIGSGTVLMPAGGLYQLTPAQCMAAKLPVEGETGTCGGMAFGFDPYLSEADPYAGAYVAVLESVAKLAASGFPLDNVYLSFQEYFPRPGNGKERWGLPFAALLGALQAQLDLGVAAIGGKDSMSGSFEELDVPPSLVSFAVSVGKATNIASGEFKNAGREVLWIRPKYQGGLRPEAKNFIAALRLLEKLIAEKKAVSVYTASRFGAAEALFKMCCGNRIGLQFEKGTDEDGLFGYAALSFLVELNDGVTAENVKKESNDILAESGILAESIGKTIPDYAFVINGETIDLDAMQDVWIARFEKLFSYYRPRKYEREAVPAFDYEAKKTVQIKKSGTKPRALIPVFPGTNCEYDTARALCAAGAGPEIFVIQNLNPRSVAQSAELLAKKIGNANMLVIPGGFSGGDEPDGSAKLIAAFFRGAAVADAVTDLFERRDGLILGICNGFQALIKLGLVPFGKITDAKDDNPTLTFNTIGRHQSFLVRTRICSTLSPWFLCEEAGAIHTMPVSHGEGRFIAGNGEIRRLAGAGQIAAQYVDLDGKASMDLRYNPAGSMMAVEAVTDRTGRILGKMAHSERRGEALYKNVPGCKTQKLFEGGVKYFCG
ncbi:MAG: phosphoribosylformylglycinamidine synthase [Spirochaetaceae bacterium]|jgi:phosphoribosylformylglycinamidine synthase|nr:phosphoribosylformylglycinamidine synthase [Spirochaetaceae bacterium]